MHGFFVAAELEATTFLSCQIIGCIFDGATFTDVIIGNYAAASERFGHENTEPRTWNLIGDQLFVDGPETPRTVSAPLGWLPPTDCSFSRWATAARFRNVLFVRCQIRIEDDSDDDDDDPRYARVTLVNCILQGKSPLVALAKKVQSPVIKGEQRMWQIYCLPDGSMPFGDVPPDGLPLP